MKKSKLYRKIEDYLYDKRATLPEIKERFKDYKSKEVDKALNSLIKDGRISEYKGKYCDYNFIYFM